MFVKIDEALTFTEVKVCVDLDGTILTKVEFTNDVLDSDDWTGRVVVLMVVNDCADGCLLIDDIFLVEITAVTLVFVIFKTVDRVAYGVVLLRAVREVTVEILPEYTVEFSTTIDIVDVIVMLVTKVESASVCVMFDIEETLLLSDDGDVDGGV